MSDSITILDRQWWGKRLFRFTGMVYKPTLAHIVSLALRKCDRRPMRRVRNLLGALANPSVGTGGTLTQIPDSVVLYDDEDVEGWLATTQAIPLRLLAILERLPADGETSARQTPPPPGCKHIDNEAFEALDEPLDTCDEDGPVTKKRRCPAMKKGYEQRLERLRQRQGRLEDHIKELERQLLDRFPPTDACTDLFNNGGSGSESGTDQDNDDAGAVGGA